MKRLRILCTGLLIVLTSIFATIVLAQANTFQLTWWTVDTGGGTSQTGSYRVIGTVGQPDAADVVVADAAQQYKVSGGLWQVVPDPDTCIALTDITISGPDVGIVDQTYRFAANVSPGQASSPINYSWSPEPLEGQGTSQAQYRWDTVGGRTISVSANNCEGTASASDEYGFNVTLLTLTGLEVTQGIQDLNNSVVLIKDKPTFVRAHIESASGLVSGMTARLVGRRNGAVLAESPLTPANAGGTIRARPIPDRGRLDESLFFELPLSWLNGSIELELVAEEQPIVCAESASDANDCRATVTFNATPVPEVSFVGITWRDTNNVQHRPEIYDALAVTRDIKAQLPIANLNWNRLSEMTWEVTGPPNMSTILSRLANQRTLDGSDRIYYGLLVGPGGDEVGLGYTSASDTPDIGAASTGYYHASVPTVASHELGHNFGRRHTNCNGDEGNPDPSFPYTGGRISNNATGDNAFFGLHIYTKDLFPPDTGDLMGYCLPHWISDWTYDAIRTKIVNHYTTANLQQTAPLVQAGERAMLVSGRVDSSTNTGSLETILITAAQSDTNPLNGGTYAIRVEDSAGNVLDAYNFEPAELSEGTERIFSFLLPDPGNVQRIVLLHNKQILDQRQVSANTPDVTLNSPRGGDIWDGTTATIGWTASDPDGDQLEYTVQYSRDGGTTWETLITDWQDTTYELALETVAGSATAVVRVLATDGFNTAQVVSEQFTIAKRAPIVEVITPEHGELYVSNQLIMLRGEAIDNEDGLLSDPALTWNSDIDGDLGTGTTVSVSALTLSEGNHTITVTAIDSDGQTATASRAITIRRTTSTPKIYLPLIVR